MWILLVYWFDLIRYDLIQFDFVSTWFISILFDSIQFDLNWLNLMWYDSIRFDSSWFDSTHILWLGSIRSKSIQFDSVRILNQFDFKILFIRCWKPILMKTLVKWVQSKILDYNWPCTLEEELWLPQTKQVSLRQCSNQFYVIQQVLAQYDFRFHGKIRVMKNRFNIKNHLINQFICKKIDQLVWLIFHNCCFLFDYIFLKSEFSKNGVSKGLAVHEFLDRYL